VFNPIFEKIGAVRQGVPGRIRQDSGAAPESPAGHKEFAKQSLLCYTSQEVRTAFEGAFFL